ncbi:hypothetical protein [uncultured Methylobacterium sp.]|uniref:hypothetical protein n=1 Tax=uncultured Methylobacterium sp. TaxID=157278 RepID=UPI0035CB2DCA
MALTQDRDTQRRESMMLSLEVAAGARIVRGALVALAGGYAAPGATAAGLVAAGRAEEAIDNTGGAAGAQRITVRRGVFLYANLAGDPVARAGLLKDCFIADDATVAGSDGGGTRSRAGKVMGIEAAGGVWVEIL